MKQDLKLKGTRNVQSLPRSQTELENNLNDLEHNFLSLDLFS